MIAPSPLQMIHSSLSGALVGFSLGLLGGGPILAVPLPVYLVGSRCRT